MSAKKKVAPSRKPVSKKAAAIKKKTAIKKPAPKQTAAPKKKVAVRKAAPKKTAAKRVPAPKKKVPIKKPTLKKAALPKKRPLPKKPASKKKAVVKAATRKVITRKKVVTNKPATQKAPVKRIVVTKPKLQKTAPRKQIPNQATPLKKAVPHKAPPQAATGWVGTSAMKAIPCPECGAKAGEMCISKEANMPIWESHPARIVAYTTSRLTSKLPLMERQQFIAGRQPALPGKNRSESERGIAHKNSDSNSCISVAWPPFAEKLAVVLGNLEEDQFLILLVKQTNRFVQFAAQGSFGMRIETTSNSYLPKTEQLNEPQISTLIDIGWIEPTGKPSESTPEYDPDGSPNFFMGFSVPVSFEAVASLAIRTLAEILRVPHPGFLQYEAFDAEGNEIALPTLGLKQAERTAQDGKEGFVVSQLLALLRGLTHISTPV